MGIERMIIARIKGANRVCGKAQGYLGLPVRDVAVTINGVEIPTMQTAWTPTPDELDRLNKGANVIVSIYGTTPAPIMLTVDDEIPELARPQPYRAQKAMFGEAWNVEREYSCINGLACWFTIATIDETSEAEHGYTDGEIKTAQERAEKIAAALNATA